MAKKYNPARKPDAPWTVTSLIDIFLDLLSHMTSGGNRVFHLFVFLLNCTLSIPNLIFYYLLDANMHVVFWMGQAPALTNFLVPAVLACVSMSLPVLTCIQLPRPVLKWSLMVVYVVASCIILGGGGYVLYQAYTVSDDLIYNCGASPLTGQIQYEWKRLWQFHQDCTKQEDSPDLLIQQCPNFDQIVEGHEVYVDYIEQMEIDYECAGFCQFWTTPLFNEAGSGRCASAIGEEVYRVGYLVALPTITTGVITVFVGTMWMNYDHI